MLKIATLRSVWRIGVHYVLLCEAREAFGGGKRLGSEHVRRRQIVQSQSRWRGWIIAITVMLGSFPSIVLATHEADHRFTVEGFVCGADGKGSPDIDVLVKDTKVSNGQIVKTDGDGHYKAAFHHSGQFRNRLYRGQAQRSAVGLPGIGGCGGDSRWVRWAQTDSFIAETGTKTRTIAG
jgi:hypothetical protein